MSSQKIRIRLKGYDHEVVDQSAKLIVDTAQKTGARVSGPIPLPTERNLYTVIRSPHKDKDSREQFEMRTHKRLIDILDPSPSTVDSLMRLPGAPMNIVCLDLEGVLVPEIWIAFSEESGIPELSRTTRDERTTTSSWPSASPRCTSMGWASRRSRT